MFAPELSSFYFLQHQLGNLQLPRQADIDWSLTRNCLKEKTVACSGSTDQMQKDELVVLAAQRLPEDWRHTSVDV
jgi:hypothetical protein